MTEEIALAGKFNMPKVQKVTDSGQEQMRLHATVEELVRHDLALRENADDGRYLVFPSQFSRDYEDAPEPKGKAVAITFDGPVQSLYSTLAGGWATAACSPPGNHETHGTHENRSRNLLLVDCPDQVRCASAGFSRSSIGRERSAAVARTGSSPACPGSASGSTVG
jgi:hypothetical protein